VRTRSGLRGGVRRLLVCAFVVGLNAPNTASICSNTSVALVPLTDLAAETFKGYSGGLYPGGNLRPVGHETAGLAEAAAVVPLNSSGAPDPNGRIVMLSIGMSNTKLEFASFQSLTSKDSALNSRLSIINGAKSGTPSQVIAHLEKAEGLRYWTDLDDKLAQFGLTPAQVQVAWVKVAEANPQGVFPDDALRLKADLAAIARILKQRFPKIRLAYYSSRIYAGYASVDLNPEPYAYQSGFAVKWLLADQIAGNADLNFDPRRGAVKAPWLAWGPYLWADGARPRSDGLTWLCHDFNSDGTHPSTIGSAKVAGLLLDFFRRDTTTQRWFGVTSEVPKSTPPRAPTNVRIVS